MKRHLLVSALLVFCGILTSPITLVSQSIANYNSVRNTGVAYNSIGATGLAFNNWRNITTFTQDDNRSDFTDIGFDFWYNGVRYTQFCVSSNGFIDFSNSTDDGGPTNDDFGYDNGAFTQANVANATRPAIAPFYDDLTAQGGTAALGNSLKYLLSGSAPNRTLTIEWINMAVYLNTTPSLNFQVKLVESTGQILINYGTMVTGTQVFSYCMGINSNTVSAVPGVTQLKMLQTVNTNVLNNTVQNNLSAMPQANSQYIFTSPVPTPTAGSLTFSGVSQSSMTLNWTNWATNEVGYVIYNSTDGINYNFITQTAANATTAGLTGLTSGTNYFWKLYAVTEGCLSNAINGTQATTSAGTRTSVTTGNWSVAATWSPVGVPALGEDVYIATGHVVTISSNANCNSLNVAGTSTLQFNGATARTFSVNKNITINTSGAFRVNAGSNVTHSISIKGDVLNNGTLDFAVDAGSLCNAFFIKNGNQTISGTGATTRFNLLNIDLGNSINNTLDVSSTTFSAAPNFLTLTDGTFKLSSLNAITITLFTPLTTIPQSTGIWLNAPNAVMNTGAGLTLVGKITVSQGTLNVGNAANEDLLSSGGQLIVSGGVVNIAGKYYAAGINNLCYCSISGGTVTVASQGSSNTTIAPFQIVGAGSQFNMSGGVLAICREGGNGGQDLGYINTVPNGAVTGGTLQIGNNATPANSIININTNHLVGNLVVNNGNVTARLNTNSLSVVNNIRINTGTLNANNFNLSLGGSWLNTAGVFTPGTGLVTFSSNSTQTIQKTTAAETFNHLQFAGSGIKTFSSAISAAGNFSVNAGASVDVSASNYSLSLRGNFVNNGSFNARNGLVHFNGTIAQTIGGSSVTNFRDITLGNAAGASLTNAENLLGTLTLTTGILNTNSQVFTMVSTATATARIAQITGSGDITGNVTVQRFAPGGTTGWALFGTPISSALSLTAWDDDIPISCPTCPDGTAGGFLSIYTYNEAVNGFYDNPNAYIPLSTINDPIVPGKGYWVYLGDGQFTTNNITVDVTGTVRKFNYTIPITRTNFGSPADDGWNLIHNPYPSPISWSALKGATANIDDAIYVYNSDLNGGAGGFATYVNGISSPGTSSGGIGNTIPMSQGFYVHSTGATSLNATEAIKVAGNPTYLKNTSSASSGPLLRLNLKYTNYDDETVLYFEPSATDQFDAIYDAIKMRGQDPYAPTIALEKGAQQFQVNGIAPISGNFTMPLKTLTGYNGSYTITANNIGSFPLGTCINLYDKFTGTTTDLKTSSYVFNLKDTTTVARFNLNITLNPLNVTSNVTQPSCPTPTGNIIASGASAGPWNYYWKSNGVAVKTSLNKNSADTLNNLVGGNFDLEMNTVGMCDNFNSSYIINEQIPPTASFLCSDTLDLDLNPYLTFTNSCVNSVLYFWTFGDGGSSTAAAPVYAYNSTGNFTIKLISWGPSGCADTITKNIHVKGTAVGINSSGINTSELIVKNQGNNEFILQQNFDGEQTLNFKLQDASGRLLVDYGNVTSDKIILPVDLRNYSSGIYFMTISHGSARKVIKLPVK